MKKAEWSAALVAIALCAYSPGAEAQSLYHSPRVAQSRCPHDTFVWLNLASRIFHFRGHFEIRPQRQKFGVLASPGPCRSDPRR